MNSIQVQLTIIYYYMGKSHDVGWNIINNKICEDSITRE